jgi:excisionase family DNA binding protein
MTARQNYESDLLTPGEVAELVHVDPKTVTRWARAGILSSIRTPGGHRRYSRPQVLAMCGRVDDGETALRGSDIQVIRDALAKGPDPDMAKARILDILALTEIGSLIRVTG